MRSRKQTADKVDMNAYITPLLRAGRVLTPGHKITPPDALEECPVRPGHPLCGRLLRYCCEQPEFGIQRIWKSHSQLLVESCSLIFDSDIENADLAIDKVENGLLDVICDFTKLDSTTLLPLLKIHNCLFVRFHRKHVGGQIEKLKDLPRTYRYLFCMQPGGRIEKSMELVHRGLEIYRYYGIMRANINFIYVFDNLFHADMIELYLTTEEQIGANVLNHLIAVIEAWVPARPKAPSVFHIHLRLRYMHYHISLICGKVDLVVTG